MTPVYVGSSVIFVGLMLMLAGLVFAFLEAKKNGLLDGAASFVDSLSRLLQALGDKPTSTILFTFGTLLVFLGGVIAGVAGLSGPSK